jgi:hypothetical protein
MRHRGGGCVDELHEAPDGGAELTLQRAHESSLRRERTFATRASWLKTVRKSAAEFIPKQERFGIVRSRRGHIPMQIKIPFSFHVRLCAGKQIESSTKLLNQPSKEMISACSI